MQRHTRTARTALGLLATVALTLGALLSPNSANAQVFFGEDVNVNGSPGVNSVPRGGRANADAANANFIAAAPSYGVENFESFAPFSGASFTLSVSFPTTTVTGTLSVTNTAATAGIWEVTSPTATIDGVYPSSGTKTLAFIAGNQPVNASINVVLSTPVLGIGFYGTDVESFRPTVRLTYTDNTTQDFTVNATIYQQGQAISGNIFFWGYKTTGLGITKMQILYAPGFADGIGIDDITILVPEPASMLALCAGLAGLVKLRRRRSA